MPEEPQEKRGFLSDPRVYLAVERTYLAWLRTGLALMGFGFVVARFGLFLRELNPNGPPPTGISARFGTALVVLGVVLTITSLARYRILLRRLRNGELLTNPSRMALAVGAALASIGAIVALYLFTTVG